MDRRQPDRVDAERRRRPVVEVVELRDQAGQVAHAVAVRVGEAARVDLVDDAALPPVVTEGGVLDGRRSGRRGTAGRTSSRRPHAGFDGRRRQPKRTAPARPGTGPVASIYSAPMTDHPSTGWTSQTVRLGVLGLGAVAQAVHLPLISGSHDRLDDRGRRGPVAVAGARCSATGTGSRRDVATARSTTCCGPATSTRCWSSPPGRTARPSSPASTTAWRSSPRSRSPTRSRRPMRSPRDSRRIPGCRLQVGYMKLYDPAVTRALAIANDREFGPPRSIEVTVLHPTSERQLAHARLEPPPHDVDPAVLADLQRRDRGPLPGGPRRGGRPGARSALRGHRARAASSTTWPSAGPSAAIRSGSTRSTSGRPTRWPPSVGDHRPPSRTTVASSIRWHFLPDYPAYREEVRVVYEAATIELAFPAPYLLHHPTDVARGRARRPRPRGPGSPRHRLVVDHRGLRGGAPRVPRPRHRGHAAGGRARRGRADIVTCQRIVGPSSGPARDRSSAARPAGSPVHRG